MRYVCSLLFLLSLAFSQINDKNFKSEVTKVY